MINPLKPCVCDVMQVSATISKLRMEGRRGSVIVKSDGTKEHSKVLCEAPCRKGVEAERRGCCISSQKGGRCWVQFGRHPPSACASRLSVFSHTTEAAFFTSMLILPATPALVLPPRHTTTEHSAAQHSLMEHVELLHNLKALKPSEDNYSVQWCESDPLSCM